MKTYFKKIIFLIPLIFYFSQNLTYGQQVGCQSLGSSNVFTLYAGTNNGKPLYTNGPNDPILYNNQNQIPACSVRSGDRTCRAFTTPGGSIVDGRLITLYECPIDDWLFLLIIPIIGFSAYSLSDKLQIIKLSQ